jgi:hypothetical protein
MRENGEYGEFFPPELSPFGYNESVVQEYFPLTKEQALAQGYRWKDTEVKRHQTTISHDQLPDRITDIDDSICQETIACAHQQQCIQQCTGAFRIIPAELAFYRQHNIALPRLCPNCRHYERIKLKNPHKLWHRRCMNTPCQNEFETSYAPDRPEKIYCEQCYQHEIL